MVLLILRQWHKHCQKPTTVDAHSSKVVSTTWKVTEGSHTIIAKFEDTRYSSDKGTATIVANSEADPYRFNVTGATDATKTPTTNKATDGAASTAEKTE